MTDKPEIKDIQHLEINPKKLSGVPVLSGTSFPICQLIAELATSGAVEGVAEEFDLNPEQCKGFFQSLAAYFDYPYTGL